MKRPLALRVLSFACVAAQRFPEARGRRPASDHIARPQLPDQCIAARYQPGARSDRTPAPFLVEQEEGGFSTSAASSTDNDCSSQESAEGDPDIDEGNGQGRVAEFLGSVEQCYVGIVSASPLAYWRKISPIGHFRNRRIRPRAEHPCSLRRRRPRPRKGRREFLVPKRGRHVRSCRRQADGRSAVAHRPENIALPGRRADRERVAGQPHSIRTVGQRIRLSSASVELKTASSLSAANRLHGQPCSWRSSPWSDSAWRVPDWAGSDPTRASAPSPRRER